MALGFGFNKAKVLASAEKFVQQGKLSNAIAEYEKIIKEDPKDLTVLNTIGDLYARTGENERAAHYFKKVGDQYAQDGFSVKAIAIYKKLTKLSPNNFDNVHKLAELYGQQGLFNDARAQYMIVADHLLKSSDNAQAAKVLQRILEFDPENTATQSKLADLYTKLGKKDDARNIYYTAAETLHARGSYDAAAEALGKVLRLDPENAPALLLRGMIAADADDSVAAVQYLGQVPDLDSRPDGLRALLRCKLYAGNLEGVEGIANKLLTVHNDVSGVTTLAEWHVGRNQVSNALKLYDQHADRFLAAGRTGFQEVLYPLIARIKDNPDALSTMLRLMQRAGDTSRSAEIMELQANAYAAKGDFRPARELYLRLTEMEPENALHHQNYKQMLSKLGEDPATRHLSPQEAAQAFMVEELDEGAAVVQQSYDPPTEKALEAALTDAELFVSYNVPAKAIPPLEAVLHMAPRDIVLHQRLAVLYARGERYADAARMCQVLSDIYGELGHEKDAVRYQEAARKYSLRAPAAPPAHATPARRAQTAVVPPPPPMPVAPAPQPVAELQVSPPAAEEARAEAEAPSVQEFTFDVPDHLLIESEPTASVPAETQAEAVVESAEPVAIQAEAAAGSAQEKDLSQEWEEMVSVEEEEGASHEGREAPPKPLAPEMEVVPSREEGPAPPREATAEKIQEIQFYISQEMWDAAKKAILDLTELAPDAPEITDFISAVSAGQARAARAAAPHVKEPVQEIPVRVKRAPEAPVSKAPPAAVPTPEMPVEIAPEPSAPALAEFAIEVEHKPAVIAEPSAELSAVETVPEEPVVPPPAPAAPKKPAKPVREEVIPSKPAPAAPARPPAKHVAPPAAEAPLEDILALAPEVAEPPAPPAPASRKKKATKAESTEQILSDFVVDLEKTDLADFVPKAKPEPIPPSRQAAAAPPATPPPVAAAAPTRDPRVAVNGDMQDAESASVLNHILAELQEETAEAPQAEEDPETHYNLGIAFKEMGLLDEAIGELQKVCHSMDRGSGFSQPIQAYTWLAQCLVDKGAPEAAVRWYQKALQLPRLDDDSRCAIYYDLAMAYEATGDKKLALANFMEVYGSNIDFRDVASRIKALKS